MSKLMYLIISAWTRHLQKIGVSNVVIAEKYGLRLSSVHTVGDQVEKLRRMIKNGEVTEDMSYRQIAKVVGFNNASSAKWQLDKMGFKS